MRTYTDSRCLDHTAPPGYPERPARLEVILERARQEGWPLETAVTIDDAAVRQAVLAVHDPEYVGRFERAVARGDGLLDSADNPLSPASWDAASGAVAATLAAAEAALAGSATFAAVRPPGHHAEHATAMGFCYFANIAVAAQHLIDQHGVERVAIVDFDVHHGNGTQHLFEDRADVFFASLHQFPLYPGTGAASETGRGAGSGATLNLPLAAASDDEVYLEAFDDALVPALAAFAPDVLLVSAGFDAWQGDPLGGMRVTEAGFEAFGRKLGACAQRHCGGRLMSALEGGYDVSRLGDLVAAYRLGLEDAAAL
ncbi:MAG: histone deacetylase [Acidobacteriota bacterium]